MPELGWFSRFFWYSAAGPPTVPPQLGAGRQGPTHLCSLPARVVLACRLRAWVARVGGARGTRLQAARVGGARGWRAWVARVGDARG